MSEGLKASSGWEMGSRWGVLMGLKPAGPGPMGAAGVAPVPNSFDKAGKADTLAAAAPFAASAAPRTYSCPYLHLVITMPGPETLVQIDDLETPCTVMG